MPDPELPPRWNYRRRAIGAAVCLSPFVLLLASLIGSVWITDESFLRPIRLRIAAAALIGGLIFTALNVYTSVRPSIYRWRYGSLDGFRIASGAPLAGSVFATLAGVTGFGDWRVATVGLIVLVFDLGGSPWFLVATWRDRSFWDEHRV